MHYLKLLISRTSVTYHFCYKIEAKKIQFTIITFIIFYNIVINDRLLETE